MKNKFLVIGFLFVVVGLFSFQVSKKKKFLDHFTTYKLDTLDIGWVDYNTIYENPSISVNEKGTAIDSVHFKVFEREGAEDLRDFAVMEKETGPMAYHKIKLLEGYYMLLIRSGGEYWNSRFYLCLYNSGDKHITSSILAADVLGDAGYMFTCTSKLRKEDNQWNIYTHQSFSEPLDYEKYEMDSMQMREVNIITAVELKDDHYFFVEKNKDERSFMK